MNGIGAALLAAAIVTMLMLCIPWRRKGTKEPTSEAVEQQETADMQAQEREAHYMRNFWSYDGSEQKEWDE